MKDTYVFIHIGKTAGTAVRAALSTQFRKGEICPLLFHRQISELPDSEREKYRLFSAHIGFEMARSLGNGKSPRLFTLLRDPVDRILSLYYYWREVEGDVGGPLIAKELPLIEFLDSTRGGVIADVHNTQTWQLAFAHDAPTRREVKKTHSEDAIYEKALRNLNDLDVIGVQEDLKQFTKALNKKFRWSIPVPKRENVTGKREKRDDVSMEIRKKIQGVTAMDIELYAHVLKRFVL